jgi:hypothetical protein
MAKNSTSDALSGSRRRIRSRKRTILACKCRRLALTVTVADNLRRLQMCSTLDTGRFAHAVVCRT